MSENNPIKKELCVLQFNVNSSHTPKLYSVKKPQDLVSMGVADTPQGVYAWASEVNLKPTMEHDRKDLCIVVPLAQWEEVAMRSQQEDNKGIAQSYFKDIISKTFAMDRDLAALYKTNYDWRGAMEMMEDGSYGVAQKIISIRSKLNTPVMQKTISA